MNLPSPPPPTWTQSDRYLWETAVLLAQRTNRKDVSGLVVIFADATTRTLTAEGSKEEKPADPFPPPVGWGFRLGEASFEGERFTINGRQAGILSLLARRPGEPVCVARLKREAFGDEATADRTVQNHVSALRRKLIERFDPTSDPVEWVPDAGGYRLTLI